MIPIGIKNYEGVIFHYQFKLEVLEISKKPSKSLSSIRKLEIVMNDYILNERHNYFFR